MNALIRTLTVIVLSAFTSSAALGRGWTFATHAGGAGNDYGDHVAVDDQGNSYVVGEFAGTARFDTITLATEGHWGVYLAKYNPEGRAVWATRLARTTAPTSDIYANAIERDRAGNIYVAGRFVTDATFGDDARTSLGSSDMFLVKLSPTGRMLWLRTPGGVGNGSYGQDGISAIALDSAGNCYLAGTYNTDARFDSIALSSGLTYETFVAKYDSSGRALWARSAGGMGALHIALGIAVDRAGNSYTTGKFFNTISFGPYSFTADDAEQKIFIAKADPNGTFLWAKEVGSGSYYGFGENVAVDAEGNAYIAGEFRASIRLGSTEYSFNNGLHYAALLVKYAADGSYQWSARSSGDAHTASGSCVRVDDDGNVFMTGGFTGQAEFGDLHVGNPDAHASAYLARLTPQGAFAAVETIAGTGTASGSAIAIAPNGDCLLIGSFTDSVSVGGSGLRSAGGIDMFLARFTRGASDVADHPAAPTPDLRLYPNPARDFVRLTGLPDAAIVEIVSLDGTTKLRTSDHDHIDLRTLRAGVYVVRSNGMARKLLKVGAEP